jgi:hypothetical protein
MSIMSFLQGACGAYTLRDAYMLRRLYGETGRGEMA